MLKPPHGPRVPPACPGGLRMGRALGPVPKLNWVGCHWCHSTLSSILGPAVLYSVADVRREALKEHFFRVFLVL